MASEIRRISCCRPENNSKVLMGLEGVKTRPTSKMRRFIFSSLISFTTFIRRPSDGRKTSKLNHNDIKLTTNDIYQVPMKPFFLSPGALRALTSTPFKRPGLVALGTKRLGTVFQNSVEYRNINICFELR